MFVIIAVMMCKSSSQMIGPQAPFPCLRSQLDAGLLHAPSPFGRLAICEMSRPMEKHMEKQTLPENSINFLALWDDFRKFV
jgi:hypothetical protein